MAYRQTTVTISDLRNVNFQNHDAAQIPCEFRVGVDERLPTRPYPATQHRVRPHCAIYGAELIEQRNQRILASLCLCVLQLTCELIIADTLKVGRNQPYSVPSEVAKFAKNGDRIEIYEGNYRGNVVTWNQDDLHIVGVGSAPTIHAGGHAAEGKAIWVIKGADVVVENVEFTNAHVPDRNGAGIRSEGRNLTVRNCVFHHNENGILAGARKTKVIVENSVFYENGHGDGKSHNIYVGSIDELTIRGSYFSRANFGHNVKSRAISTNILYNRITDGPDGQSSYLVDLPNGGMVEMIGNVLQQGPEAANGALVSFGTESQQAKTNELFVVNNTFVNDRHSGVFLKIASPYVRVHVQNNIFLGKGDLSNQDVRSISNISMETESRWFFKRKVFIDREKHDYRLADNSPAIDAGTSLAVVELSHLQPLYEYLDTAALTARRNHNRIDIGAYEWRPK